MNRIIRYVNGRPVPYQQKKESNIKLIIQLIATLAGLYVLYGAMYVLAG